MSEPDANQAPPRSNWQFWLYWALLAIVGATVALLVLPELSELGSEHAAVLVIASLLLLLELGPLLRGRAASTSGLSSSLMFEFALLIHWGAAGLGVSILVHFSTLLVIDLVNHRALWRTVFNTALLTATLGSAYLVLLVFGQHGSLAAPAAIEPMTLLAIAAAGVLSLGVNAALLCALDAAKFNISWWRETLAAVPAMRSAALNDGAALALAPLVVLAADRGPWLVPLLLIPLYAVYRGNVASVALKHQAGHDALTGLPNRSFLLARAGEVLPGTPEQGAVALFVLDLDGFKAVNDTLGHLAGDRLLQVVAERLRAAIRPGDLVARLGGDEFAVLLPDALDEATVRKVASRIDTALRAPLSLDGLMLSVESSLGIAMTPGHGSDFETLLRSADLAMYSAKGRGIAHEIYSTGLTSRPSTGLLA